ncbi:MAG: phosphoglycolate phosphatase [Gammaproteobacteria bacterium]|nr:phosphoglycolate phosphatase [Gammaproteobacteria bacterium]
MTVNKPDLILIDLDGTLVDSVPDLAFCVDTMMQEMGMPAHGENKVREWVGNGVERLVKRALVGRLEGEPAAELFDKAYPIFLTLYRDNNSKRSCVYPGVMGGLDWLTQQGYKLGCVTNKAEQFTLPLLNNLGLDHYFSLVISGDTLPRKKPDPMPLLHAAAFFSVLPEKSMLLGDSISDVKAARAAGFNVVCVSYGYNHGNDIRDASPDAVIDSFEALSDLLN